jgi:hypothetical protein
LNIIIHSGQFLRLEWGTNSTSNISKAIWWWSSRRTV